VTYTRERLGELLVKAGMVTAEQLEATLTQQQQQGGKLGRLFVEMGFAERNSSLTCSPCRRACRV
jgi:type IV pilus assembly protein PilB